MTTEDALPELPEPTIKPYYPPAGFQHYPPATVQATVEVAFPQAWYTGAQMRAYALAALTLVQAERDAMQQERDELRAALELLVEHAARANARRTADARQCLEVAIDNARAALTPKATQQETRA